MRLLARTLTEIIVRSKCRRLCILSISRITTARRLKRLKRANGGSSAMFTFRCPSRHVRILG